MIIKIKKYKASTFSRNRKHGKAKTNKVKHFLKVPLTIYSN